MCVYVSLRWDLQSGEKQRKGHTEGQSPHVAKHHTAGPVEQKSEGCIILMAFFASQWGIKQITAPSH